MVTAPNGPRRDGILFIFDDNFIRQGLVAVSTALAHTVEDVPVFVGSVGLSPDARSRLRSLPGGDRVTIVEVAGLLDGISVEGRLTPATWARVFAAEIVPGGIDRLLYLDADTMTRSPLAPVFDVDLHDKTLGAVVDNRPTHGTRGYDFWSRAGTPPGSAYFNAGVLLIDMARWRANRVQDRALAMLADGIIPLDFHDQDALNAVLWDDWHPLTRQWNYSYLLFHVGADQAAVVHFVNPRRPWLGPVPNPTFQREYRKAARLVGWRIGNGLGGIAQTMVRGMVPTFVTERRQRRMPLPRGGHLLPAAVAPADDGAED